VSPEILVRDTTVVPSTLAVDARAIYWAYAPSTAIGPLQMLAK
jgi:hypothetical protein